MLGNPCANGSYQHLDESDRSVSSYGVTNICDTDLDFNIWYRVSGSAGNALASKNRPPHYSCGTTVPVYLKDDHPAFSDGEVTRTACSATVANPCNKEVDIQVINCGAFYLYNLAQLRPCNPATDDWRYCTNGQGTYQRFFRKLSLVINNYTKGQIAKLEKNGNDDDDDDDDDD